MKSKNNKKIDTEKAVLNSRPSRDMIIFAKNGYIHYAGNPLEAHMTVSRLYRTGCTDWSKKN